MEPGGGNKPLRLIVQCWHIERVATTTREQGDKNAIQGARTWDKN